MFHHTVISPGFAFVLGIISLKNEMNRKSYLNNCSSKTDSGIMRNNTHYCCQAIDHTSPCICFCFSEEVINRIIALTKEQGDAIDDKVSIHYVKKKK